MDNEFRSERQRTRLGEHERKPKKLDSFLRLLQIQIVLCAIVFLGATCIKIINNNLYATVKTGCFNASYRLTNIASLNSRLDSLSNSNRFFSFFFGRNKTASVFSASKTATTTPEPTPTPDISSVKDTTSSVPLKNAAQGSGELPIVFESSLPDSFEEYDELQNDTSELKIPPFIEEKLTITQKMVAPLSGRVSSPFGVRQDPFTNKLRFHTGTDIAAASGTNVKAAMSGTVKIVNYGSVGGKYIIIEHSEGFSTYYGHLSKTLVKSGQKVSVGKVIALSGNTGRSTGPHLHFEMRKDNKYLNTQNYFSY